MAQMKVPTIDDDDIYTTQYRTLLGVDFQKDATDVDKTHSPDMVNMISDLGGNPIKRDGYRKFEEDDSVATYPAYPYVYFVSILGTLYGIKKWQAEDTTKSKIAIIKVKFEDQKVKQISVEKEIEIDTEHVNINRIIAYSNYILILCTGFFIRFDTVTKEHLETGLIPTTMSTGDLGASSPMADSVVPLTTIAISDPENGTGGSTLYGKNLLSIYQKCSYGLSDPNDGTAQSITTFKIPNYSKITNYVKVEVMNSNGVWEETTDYTLGTTEKLTGYWEYPKIVNGELTTVRADCTVEVCDPVVTLNTAPSYSPVAGQDNVRITYVPFSMDVAETSEDGTTNIYKGFYNANAVKIFASEVFTTYNTRLLVGIDNKAFYSEPSTMFMIPDNYWFEVDNQIMSFAKLSSNLAVITSGSGENTIYIATESTQTIDSTTGETETTYSVKPSNSGIGAINGSCVGSLNDEPLFLTRTGIYGILTNYLSDKYAVGRSSRINRQLCKETNLENAVGVTYNGYFYIAINTHMYVLDGRHKDSLRGNETSYECYYFENMPNITDMFVVDDVMFMTDGETTYRWNDDLSESDKYYDEAYETAVTKVEFNTSESGAEPTLDWVTRSEVLEREITDTTTYWTRYTYDNGDIETVNYLIPESREIVIGTTKWTGTPVCCKWCSAYDDDGAPQKLKILMKKGTMVTVQPHAKSSVELTLIKDGDDIHKLGIYETSMLNFERIDLTKFSFKSNQIASDIFTKKKVKKYKRLQFVLENNRAEPFGITNVVKTYYFGNYAKR